MPEAPEKLRVVWVITPHQDGEYDECWLPAETDEDHDRALAYATERLEDAWDQAGPDEPRCTITIEQMWVSEQDYQFIVCEPAPGEDAPAANPALGEEKDTHG